MPGVYYFPIGDQVVIAWKLYQRTRSRPQRQVLRDIHSAWSKFISFVVGQSKDQEAP